MLCIWVLDKTLIPSPWTTHMDYPKWLCIKVGRGQGDGDIGTRVWGLGTWGRETRDLGTSSMGRGDVKN